MYIIEIRKIEFLCFHLWIIITVSKSLHMQTKIMSTMAFIFLQTVDNNEMRSLSSSEHQETVTSLPPVFDKDEHCLSSMCN